ncbi:16S rRNA (uracil(1498)-N(3))-methyltransferase (EC [Bathymodiolus thermophilus thioautotrophic gill symbiont]|jgi:16S rRNA (uracil1498-N3)-methyltransferase|uniref:16S rRNA (Uracil(1498)-N(3))-methyltransferase (EC) n=3 Tax=sulfur-oxidizing symbionts TaxID=32036 RepID=A0ACA8ZQY0_9GAMM|nr:MULTISPECIES: 16S rRNA (uracil(1498)-N(3))-methyltransferase [sulfur-oxidizing symbionts]CAC9488504.1 16S rRNA (uracil(1498)-N(3))-methyltransferase (EC 2.1.1.193) [uncultured Gammaproteobacteria bacterium]CAB5501214.1 16S rRNA (uracil(1498)-N(3))-methyltransferase (EC [Bathymodiolus azoricus thioautotrophic gill symbiont]CAB5508458.1 16S rRNA (uracil(1498)-N(3))-methyltransferase (EC [Bathymodiolus thermophilus thioautotrophic gill symbiont]CAC9498808.1 16S rRNA (uracil(1498)-N(3))-methyltr
MKNVRLYHNAPLSVGEELTLDAFSAHHLTKVLRFPIGQNIILFNGDGLNYNAEVLQTKKNCTVQILEKTQNPSESKLHLTLAQGIAKGEKMDFLIQKAVELGVNKIIPILTEHCVVKLKGEKLTKRQSHWQKIVISACEQSGRSVVPGVFTPINLTDFLQQPTVNGFVLHHRSKQTLLKTDTVNQATILIGPEGGLSKAEISQATQAGYQSLLLGTRILRTETASLVAIANMQLLWGN